MSLNISELKRPVLGAHMSIAGGVDRAVDQGNSIGCEVIQIFTKPSRNWSSRSYTKEEVERFKSNLKKGTVITVIAHDSYLLNLGSPNESLRKKSIAAMRDEMERCETLGIPYLIAHPGSHTGVGVETGIRNICKSIDEVHVSCKGYICEIALEITAGQGSNLGCNFDQIRSLIEGTKNPERVKVCFDTEHAFAGGYDLRTKECYEKTFSEFEAKIGLEKIVAFHINDSKKELGSRVDRHEHIGKGFLGLEPFRLLMNDKRFRGIPMCLETPKGTDLKEDVENLKILRSLIRDSGRQGDRYP